MSNNSSSNKLKNVTEFVMYFSRGDSIPVQEMKTAYYLGTRSNRGVEFMLNKYDGHIGTINRISPCGEVGEFVMKVENASPIFSNTIVQYFVDRYSLPTVEHPFINMKLEANCQIKRILIADIQLRNGMISSILYPDFLPFPLCNIILEYIGPSYSNAIDKDTVPAHSVIHEIHGKILGMKSPLMGFGTLQCSSSQLDSLYRIRFNHCRINLPTV